MAHPIFGLARSSTPISAISGPLPGGTGSVLEKLPRADHGRLTPWRFILYRERARLKVGEYLAQRAEEIESPMPEGTWKELARAPYLSAWCRRLSRMSAFRNGNLPFGNSANEPLHGCERAGYAPTGWIYRLVFGRRFARAFWTDLMNVLPEHSYPERQQNQVPERQADMGGIVTEYSGPWTQA